MFFYLRRLFAFLFLITDAYSRKIIGWQLSKNMGSKNALDALNMALLQLINNTGDLYHHSDRGLQYCCSKYISSLQKNNIKISMTENGDPYENAIAERVNGILKTEWLYEMKLKNYTEAHKSVKNIIDIYNSERPHTSIEMLTPNEAHSMTGSLKKLWKSYKQKKENKVLNEI
jgi:putative transposase